MGLLAQVEKLVPGTGPLPERLKAFRAKFAIPKNRLKLVFDALIAACRARMAAFEIRTPNPCYVGRFERKCFDPTQ